MSFKDMVRCVMIAICIATVALPALADDGRGGEIGILFGGSDPGSDVFGSGADSELALGLRGGSVFAPRWGWFIDGLWMQDDTGSTDTQVRTARTGFELLFMPERDNRMFVSFGGGKMWLDRETLADLDGPMASVGLGMRYKLEGNKRLRWELRADQGLDDDDFGGEEPQITSFLIGLNWGPGSGQIADADGDGVSDRKDRCPDTARGAIVDERGCAKDSDADGVADGIDRCPNTTRGWPVDARGCAKDSDGDGVADGADDCANTPRGAKVDAKGCPNDSDGDGVFDGIDTCADTPRGAKVDARGCPKDADGDGVADGIDTCANTPRGARVDARGCPKDGDADGVADGIDKCPDTPRGTAVKPDGCTRAQALFDEEQRTLVLEGVFFETNEATLTASSRSVLDRVARSLVDWPEVRIEIGGHTDSRGRDAYNLDLSARRADAVRAYLSGKGVSDSRMKVRGYGESKPAASNETAAGRAKNRRVELTRLD